MNIDTIIDYVNKMKDIEPNITPTFYCHESLANDARNFFGANANVVSPKQIKLYPNPLGKPTLQNYWLLNNIGR